MVLPVAGGCGIGFSLLPESFPSEDEGSSDGVMVVARRMDFKARLHSDLYRGRVGGTVSVADTLTPAGAECDRRRPSVDGTGTVGGCVVREGDIGKGVVILESGG